MSDVNPNWFAYLALVMWPVVAWALYSRLRLGRATLWTILGGYLLLPVGLVIKIPMVPGGFEKSSIPSLAALAGCTIVTGRLPKFFRGFGLVEVLVLGIIVGPFITSALNGDDIRIGARLLPGVGMYDAGSAALFEFTFILPFFLARQYLRGAQDIGDILRILVVAGLGYSLPILFEVRFSPQLHTWVYGYFPTSFIQEFRDGGFRPVVFLGHGLLVAFFTLTTTVSAAALWRTQTSVGRFAPSWVTGYLGFILLLCKTGNALVYAFLLLPLARWAGPRLQVRVACVLVCFALAYPMLRVADLIPTTSILEMAHDFSKDRADSLGTRFYQEHLLLDHAWQRKWFGWGRFGRGRVYDENGIDISIPDGWWVNIMCDSGLFGFFANFGLLALGVFRAARALKFAPTEREREYLGALALIAAVNIFDLIPNAPISPWTWLLVGALVGRAEALRTALHVKVPASGQLFPAGGTV
jgi:hypothetical protein